MRATLKLTCDVKDFGRTLAALLEEIKVHQLEDELVNKLDICVHRLRNDDSEYWSVLSLIDQVRQRLAQIDLSLMEKSMILEGYLNPHESDDAQLDDNLPDIPSESVNKVTQEVDYLDIMDAEEIIASD